jgi:hypothetical protein
MAMVSSYILITTSLLSLWIWGLIWRERERERENAWWRIGEGKPAICPSTCLSWWFRVEVSAPPSCPWEPLTGFFTASHHTSVVPIWQCSNIIAVDWFTITLFSDAFLTAKNLIKSWWVRNIMAGRQGFQTILRYYENGGSMFYRNVGNYLQDRNLPLQHRRNLRFHLERNFLGLLVGARVSSHENCEIK